jgi:hypothetical protein
VTRLAVPLASREALTGSRTDPVVVKTAMSSVSSPTPQRWLAGAVLVEAHDQWQVSDRRYLPEGSMAVLNRPTQSTKEVAQPALIASPQPWPRQMQLSGPGLRRCERCQGSGSLS